MCGADPGLAWGHRHSHAQPCPALGGIEITRMGSKGKVDLAPCDAVVSGASGVPRIGGQGGWGGKHLPDDFPIFDPHLVFSSLLTSLASTDMTRALCHKPSQNSWHPLRGGPGLSGTWFSTLEVPVVREPGGGVGPFRLGSSRGGRSGWRWSRDGVAWPGGVGKGPCQGA